MKNRAQQHAKCTPRSLLSLQLDDIGNGVIELISKDAQKATHQGHQGGATCKFSAHSDVELVRTKNRIFHPAEPTKSNTLNPIIVQKYRNENAARSPLGRRAILSQIDVLLCRFSVPLDHLSEPDPYDDPHEPRRGNLIDFKQNRGSWDVHAPDPDRSTRHRHESHSHVHFHADFAPTH